MAVIILGLAFVLSLIIELPVYVEKYRKQRETKQAKAVEQVAHKHK